MITHCVPACDAAVGDVSTVTVAVTPLTLRLGATFVFGLNVSGHERCDPLPTKLSTRKLWYTPPCTMQSLRRLAPSHSYPKLVSLIHPCVDVAAPVALSLNVTTGVPFCVNEKKCT